MRIPFTDREIKLIKHGKREHVNERGGKSKIRIRTNPRKGVFGGRGFGSGARNNARLQQYYNYFSTRETIHKPFEINADNICMNGFRLVSDDENALAKVREFFDNVPVDLYVREAYINACLYGDSVIEIIYGKGKQPINLHSLPDPTKLEMEWSDSTSLSEEVKYSYAISRTEKIELPPENVIHIYTTHRIPGSPYHLSILEPLMDTIKQTIEAEANLSIALERYSVPVRWIEMITTGELGYIGEIEVTDTDMETTRKEFEDLARKNEIITTDGTKIHTLDAGGTENIKPLFDYFLAKHVIGLMVPQEIMGLESSSTNAVSETREKVYQKYIRTRQRILENQINTQLIDRITNQPGLVKIKFNESLDAEAALRAQWTQRVISATSALQRIYIQAGIDPPLEVEEVRKIIKSLVESMIDDTLEVKDAKKKTPN
jgi:hypothetical protein